MNRLISETLFASVSGAERMHEYDGIIRDVDVQWRDGPWVRSSFGEVGLRGTVQRASVMCEDD
jgi:hypothetical protein